MQTTLVEEATIQTPNHLRKITKIIMSKLIFQLRRKTQKKIQKKRMEEMMETTVEVKYPTRALTQTQKKKKKKKMMMMMMMMIIHIYQAEAQSTWIQAGTQSLPYLQIKKI